MTSRFCRKLPNRQTWRKTCPDTFSTSFWGRSCGSGPSGIYFQSGANHKNFICSPKIDQNFSRAPPKTVLLRVSETKFLRNQLLKTRLGSKTQNKKQKSAFDDPVRLGLSVLFFSPIQVRHANFVLVAPQVGPDLMEKQGVEMASCTSVLDVSVRETPGRRSYTRSRVFLFITTGSAVRAL